MTLQPFTDPPLKALPPYLKILSLVIIVISSFLLVFTIGVGISIPLFGKGILESVTLGADFSDPKVVTALKYFQVVNQFGVFIIPAVVFVLLTDESFTAYLHLRDGSTRFSILYGFILVMVSLPFVNWILEVNQDMHLPAFLSGVEEWMRRNEDNASRLTNAFLDAGTFGGYLVNLLMIAVFAAIGEELVFRGILVRLFYEWTRNLHLAVIIPALLFSALHIQFFGFFARFALGLMLGYLFVWTGSLWVPIVVHFINNAAAVTISYLGTRGVISDNLESFGYSENPIVIAGSFVLVVFIMFLIYYHERVVRPRRVGHK